MDGRSNTAAPIGVMLLTSSLEHGGAERQAVELMRRLDRTRFAPFVCSLSRDVPLAEQLPDRSRDLVIVEKHWRFDATTIPRVARVMKARGVSIVHAFLFDAEMTGRLGSRLARVPVMIGSERNADHGRPWIQSVLLRATRSSCDAVIANSHAGKRFAMREMGLPDDRVHVVHNGVDVECFQPLDRLAARRALGIAPDGPVVGMVASFKPQKNHAMFLHMARRVRERFADARFLLVGGQLAEGGGAGFSLKPGAGYHRDVAGYHRSIRRMIDELGLAPHCILAGRIDDMVRCYNACDVTVLTSRHEGTPNVLLESMACGVPVVATDVADNSYVVPQGRAGFVVRLDDFESMASHVCALLADPPRWAAMGREGRAWVEREFSTTKLAQATETIYMNLLRRKAPRGVCRVWDR